jgi:PST family polysaccharide transporter
MSKEHSEDTRRTIGNLSSTFLVRFARYPFLALYIFTIPRMLGAYNYGMLALVISILMLSSEILTFGVSTVFGRYIPEYIIKKETLKLERLISSYLIFEFLISIVLGLTGIILVFSINQLKNEIIYVIIIFFTVISEVYSGLLFSVLFGLNYVGKANAVNLFRTVFRLLFLLSLYPILGFTGALLSLLLTPVLSGLYALYSIQKVIKLKIRKPILKEFLPKLKFGIIIFTPALLFLFQQQIGPVFLKLFSLNNSEIGFFDLANQGFLVLYGLAITGFEALIPISSKFQVTGKGETGIYWLFMLLRYILPILLIIVITFYLFGEGIITILLGKQFINIYPIALIILISVPVWIIGQLGYVRSVVLLNPKPYIISTLLSTIVFILSGLFFINKLGAIGLAIAVLLSGTVYSVYISLLYKEMFDNLLSIIKKIFLPAISFLPLLVFKVDSIEIRIIIFLFSTFLFLGILLKLKIINLKELKQLDIIIQKKIPAEDISD